MEDDLEFEKMMDEMDGRDRPYSQTHKIPGGTNPPVRKPGVVQGVFGVFVLLGMSVMLLAVLTILVLGIVALIKYIWG